MPAEEEDDLLPIPFGRMPEPKDVETVADLLERRRRAEQVARKSYHNFLTGIEESKAIFATCQRWWREMQALSGEGKPEE